MQEQPDVTHVLLYVTRAGGDLSLVECGDAVLLVLRDGRPVEGCRWTREQLAAAVARFHQLGGEPRSDALA